MQIHRRALIAATMVPVAAGHAPPSHGREPSWRAAAPLPWPAQEVHAAVWNGRIAVAGASSAAPTRRCISRTGSACTTLSPTSGARGRACRSRVTIR